MPNVTMSIPHQLGRAEAKRLIEEKLGDVQKQYGHMGQIGQRWDGDTLEFTATVGALKVTGHLFVEDQVVRVDIPLPWPLSMMAGVVQNQIEQQGRKLLSKS